MIEKINEPVSVEFISNIKTSRVYPAKISWRGTLYSIQTVGLHHVVRSGRTLLHVFSVTDGNLFFRLTLNTENLQWQLEEVADMGVN
jgi:hypothetical protein